MTPAQRDISRKLRVFNYAKQIGKVTAACRHFGISREIFYRWERAYEKDGEQALVNSSTRKKTPSHSGSDAWRRRRAVISPATATWHLGITLITIIAFYVVPAHLAYMLNELGIRSTRTIGLILGFTAVTKMIGSLIFHRLNIIGFTTTGLLALSCALSGSGLLILAAATTMNGAATGVLINGFGGGLLIPTLLTWNMRTLPLERRGLGTGAWTAGTFLGQFVNPLAVLAIAGIAGGRAAAVHLIGMGLLALMGISLAASLKSARKPERTEVIEHG